jgi:hypothetical protein
MAGVTKGTNWALGGTSADYSSAGSFGFIPAIWSGKLVERFYDATVFGAIANTDYEGEIRGYGDTVQIRTIPTITIGDYTIGQSIKAAYQQPSSAKVELSINKAKYFAFQVDKIDAMQSDLNLMDLWAQSAGEQMKVEIDKGILGSIYADVAAANKGQTAGRISQKVGLGVVAGGTNGSNSLAISNATNSVLATIVKLGQVLDEQNCPETGRWLVIPAWFAARLKLSDIRDASITADQSSVLRNGRIGMIDRFEVFISNNVYAETQGTAKLFHVLAGHKKALTFASQMTEMETLPNPETFGSLVRGLNVYGFKVVDPNLIAEAIVMEANFV